MKYEKIVVNSDGSKYKITVDIFEISSSLVYRVSVQISAKNKRKFQSAYDEDSYQFRALSMPERFERTKQNVIKLIGVMQYNNTLIEAHTSLKPALEV